MQSVTDVPRRLSERREVGVDVFGAALDLRASRYGEAGYSPSGEVGELFDGAYYLESVDELHRRSYGRVAKRA